MSWRDVEARPLAQVADALGKIAQMLAVPPEALWPRIPGVTQTDMANWQRLKDQAQATDPMRRLADQVDRHAAPLG